MRYSIKLKIILFLSIFIICIIRHDLTTVYQENITMIEGKILSFKIDGNLLTLEVKAKEKVSIQYRIETEEEKQYFSSILLGQKVEVTGVLQKPSTNTNFSLFNYQNYLKSKKIYWIMDAEQVTIKNQDIPFYYKIKNMIINHIESYSHLSPYLKTFLLGNQQEMIPDIVESHQINGISHLFAISGMHVSLLASILLYLLTKCHLKETLCYKIVLLFLLFYCFLANFTPSLMRAFFLFMGLYLKKQFGFQYKNDRLLLTIAICFLFYNPYFIYHLGFVFSFSISYFLIRFSVIINRSKGKLMKIWKTSLISFCASFPIVIQNFFQINLWTPIINILFVPLVSIVVFPLLLLTFLIRPLEPITWLIIEGMENMSLFISKFSFMIFLAKVPTFLFILYFIMIYLVFYKWERNKKIWFLLPICIFFIHYHYQFFVPYDMYTMLDIGQGDASLIQLKHNQGTILIDTGGHLPYQLEEWQKKKKEFSLASSVIVPYLRSLGIRKINLLIISHGDADHGQEAIPLLKQFPVDQIILNSGFDNYLERQIVSYADTHHIAYQHISQGVIYVHHQAFYFLNDIDTNNENEDSLIVYTQINNQNILLMGDAGEKSEKFIINEYILPKMDILKVGHHGSRTSSSVPFLTHIMPRLSLISAGRNNRFNHPHDVTIQNLQNRNIPFLITSEVGSIEILLIDHLPYRTCLSMVR